MSDRLRLAPDPSSAAAARRFVRDALRRRNFSEDLVDNAVLLTSELVTNAVLHTETPVELRIHVEHDLRVEVLDGSAQLPRSRVHDQESMTGRGLQLVEEIATRFGVTVTPPNGTTVWFAPGESAPGEQADDWELLLPPQPRPGYSVVLRHLPVALYEVMREQYEALLREYNFVQLGSRDSGQGELSTDVALADRSRRLIVEAFEARKSRQDNHIDSRRLARRRMPRTDSPAAVPSSRSATDSTSPAHRKRCDAQQVVGGVPPAMTVVTNCCASARDAATLPRWS